MRSLYGLQNIAFHVIMNYVHVHVCVHVCTYMHVYTLYSVTEFCRQREGYWTYVSIVLPYILKMRKCIYVLYLGHHPVATCIYMYIHVYKTIVAYFCSNIGIWHTMYMCTLYTYMYVHVHVHIYMYCINMLKEVVIFAHLSPRNLTHMCIHVTAV